ncbi:hypothetical protein [Vibrio crassostreae]|uniref:hypothetical protein n=1 Tax=Vibrio crassostreae TaxID=246167 RepID=UPI001B3033FD|nr:hypothetical protein [Vibrio crassostreae]
MNHTQTKRVLLSESEKIVLNHFEEQLGKGLPSPTHKELTELIGWNSQNAAVTATTKLIDLQYLKRKDTHLSRGITLNHSYDAPVISSKGKPTGKTIKIDRRLFEAPPHYILDKHDDGRLLVAVHQIKVLHKDTHGKHRVVRFCEGRGFYTEDLVYGSATRRTLKGLEGVCVGTISTL